MGIYINHVDELIFKMPILYFLPLSTLLYPNYLALFFLAKNSTTLLLTNSVNKHLSFFILEYLELLCSDHSLTDFTIPLHHPTTNVSNFLYYLVKDIPSKSFNLPFTDFIIHLYLSAKNVASPSSNYTTSFYLAKNLLCLCFALIKLSTTIILASQLKYISYLKLN